MAKRIQIGLQFETLKEERKCRWLLRQFASEKQLIIPKSTEDYMKMHRDRGLGMQHREGFKKTFFPTEDGWRHFREFIDLLHSADPYRSRTVYNDVFQAFSEAFARLLSDGLLPDEVDDFFEYLPDKFVNALTGRFERVAVKLNGVEFDGAAFYRIGYCWIGQFGSINFDCLSDTYRESSEKWLESIEKVYESSGCVLLSNSTQGTSDYVQQEAVYHFEISVSALCVMLNMSYENAFHRLWRVRSMRRPEQGYSKHFSFSFISDSDDDDGLSLGVRTQSMGQWFNINAEILDRWYQQFGLSLINQLISSDSSERTDLHLRWLNALFYFRQAATQQIPEMQIATLWVCVEVFYTANNNEILDAIIPGLLAATAWSMPMEFWPKKSQTLSELEAVFKKYYGFRSRTFHHGRRGHVTDIDVQEFSSVVSNLIVAIAHLIGGGISTADELLQRSRALLKRVSQTESGEQS